MSKYLAIEELSFDIEQVKLAIDVQQAKVTTMIANRDDVEAWMDGHVAEEVAHLASLITQLHTMRSCRRMLNKQGE